ncbi:hypothetical protein [Campylobacter phage CJLB-7]|nr:hypothetical protein [Campylobacter phage CJLB-7]
MTNPFLHFTSKLFPKFSDTTSYPKSFKNFNFSVTFIMSFQVISVILYTIFT